MSKKPNALSPELTTRRQVLAMGAAAALSGGALASAILRQRPKNLYAPFRMGIQSYSLRGYDFTTAVEKTKGLGLHFWEAFQDHIPQTTDMAVLQPILDKLKAAEIQLKVWGVQSFDGDEAKSRKIFEFAKLAGLETISAVPSPEALPILDKLSGEFRVRIAIHNHGPGSRFSTLADFEKAFERRSTRIGACIDTGHALRSGEDPVEWVFRMSRRVHDVHLKDVKDKTKWSVLGQGDLRLIPFLNELKRQRFAGTMMLEYEESPSDPMRDISDCLKALRVALGSDKG